MLQTSTPSAASCSPRYVFDLTRVSRLMSSSLPRVTRKVIHVTNRKLVHTSCPRQRGFFLTAPSPYPFPSRFLTPDLYHTLVGINETKQLIRPRDGREHVLNDVTCCLLLEISVNSSANPHVVRPVLLLLTEIANTYQPSTQTRTQTQTATAAGAGAVVVATAPAESGETADGAGEETTLSAKAPPDGVDDGATTTTEMKADPDRDPRCVMRPSAW